MTFTQDFLKMASDAFPTAPQIALKLPHTEPITLTTINRALDIVERYGFSHYDSLVFASALQADCTTLYSEDMQHGQNIDNQLIIINPFLYVRTVDKL